MDVVAEAVTWRNVGGRGRDQRPARAHAVAPEVRKPFAGFALAVETAEGDAAHAGRGPKPRVATNARRGRCRRRARGWGYPHGRRATGGNQPNGDQAEHPRSSFHEDRTNHMRTRLRPPEVNL